MLHNCLGPCLRITDKTDALGSNGWAGAMKILNTLSRLMKDRGGNFGIMTAILAPVLIGAGGIAVDLTRAMQVKAELSGYADAASLAASTALAEKGKTKAEAIELAKSLYAGQLVNYMKTGKENDAQIAAMVAAHKAAMTVTITEKANGAKGKAYSVTVSSNYNMQLNAMTGLVAGTTMALATSSTSASATAGTVGISMYLVLDRSGSMSFKTSTEIKNTSCVNYTDKNWGNKDKKYWQDGYIAPESPCYVRKIDALKTAANSMFSALDKVEGSSDIVRVGAVSYTDQMQPVSAITWGTTKAKKYVSDLPGIPEGGTDANDAMQTAFNALKKDGATEPGVSNKQTEAAIQNKKGNDSVNRFIVLMTDGEMTGERGGWKEYLDTGVRQKCAAAEADGIEIFTVAFMAPDNGKKLLRACASETSYYYEPENMEDLVKAFGEIANKATKSATRLTH